MRALRYLYQLMASLWFKTWYDECSKEFTYAYLISDLQTLNSYVWFHIIILFNCRFKWKRLSFFLFIYLFLRERSVIWILMYDCWSQKKGWREFEQRTNDLKEWWLGEKAGITLGEKKKKSERERDGVHSVFSPSLSLPFSCCLCVPCRNVLAFHFFLCVCPSGPSRQCLMPQQGHGKHRDTFMATSSLCENLVLPCPSFPYELLIK